MTNIGAFEAKTHLSRLLEQVAAGEKFIITRHGKPVAQLVPIDIDNDAGTQRLRRAAAVERLKSVGNGNRLDQITIRDLIDDGRKY
jgi:prevent-host-death family protein